MKNNTALLNKKLRHHILYRCYVLRLPMERAEKCISCGKGLIQQGSATFVCPNCSAVIGRCQGCREQSIPYTCKKCGFTGP